MSCTSFLLVCAKQDEGTSLHIASSLNFPEVVSLLLESNAGVNAKTESVRKCVQGCVAQGGENGVGFASSLL